ncbi:hypothetical protein [Nocardia anaemiae]|uniref:hypothetical protein n=1 Tax=Nocardia anaemiae TaxID=263910 RepID=UPI000A8D3EA7|nr:hypothetical protein [Nocardia anaemiae]
MVRRSDPINDRQADLLERIADGDTLSKPDDSPQRTTAYALQARGLITISKRAGVFTASITDAGKYYLKHGRHPEAPVSTTGHFATKTAEAKTLIDRIRKAPNETVRISEPDEQTRAAYRRAVHAAKQSGLVPKGRVLRYTGRSSGDIIVRLLDADQPDETDWNRVRLRARKPKFGVQDLRQLLTENPAAIQVSDSQRERAVRFLLELNNAAAKHDQEVRIARRGQYAKLGYRVGMAQWDLTLVEDYVDSRGHPADRWQIKYSYNGVKPTGKLRLTIGSSWSTNSNTWTDDKRSPLERRVRQIINDVKAAFDRAERQREEDHRKHLAQLAEWERQQAEEQREWESTLADARPKATAMLRRRTLVAALRAWRAAQDLRQICTVLDSAAAVADQDGDPKLAVNLRNWSVGGRELAERLDPTTGLAALGVIDFDIEPAADDLRPYLKGWSPDGPHKDYHMRSLDELSLSRPWPSDWELGKLGR